MDPSHLRLREGATAWSESEHETVLLDLNRSSYLGVNPAGTLLWSMLAQGTTRAALIAELRKVYPISESQAEHDVDEFLRQCSELGYVS